VVELHLVQQRSNYVTQCSWCGTLSDSSQFRRGAPPPPSEAAQGRDDLVDVLSARRGGHDAEGDGVADQTGEPSNG
jgi:hypothetical protein